MNIGNFEPRIFSLDSDYLGLLIFESKMNTKGEDDCLQAEDD